MASPSHLNHLPCNTLSVTPLNSRFTSGPSVFPSSSVRILGKPIGKPRITAYIPKLVFSAQALTNDDPHAAVAVSVEEEEKQVEPTEIDKLKKALVDSFYGTDRGLRATSDTRAKIVELITQLEAKNPTAAPTEALTLLNGKWILVYTSFASFFPLLSRGKQPLVKVEEISQTIDSQAFTVLNSVRFAGPLATTSISTNATFEVRSPKRVQIKFEEGIIGTPQLIDSLVIPENVKCRAHNIDLTPFKDILTSVQDTATSVVRTISSQPLLKIPISNSKVESWLLTTYLDEELRISRGDGDSVFVLIKEGSFLLTG